MYKYTCLNMEQSKETFFKFDNFLYDYYEKG